MCVYICVCTHACTKSWPLLCSNPFCDFFFFFFGRGVAEHICFSLSLSLPPMFFFSPPLLGDMMKFPETKTRSPFYKTLSPLVEKAPMVPFISSFLRCRPGPGCTCRRGPRGTLPRCERSGAGCERGSPGRPEPLPWGPESVAGSWKETEAGLGVLRYD